MISIRVSDEALQETAVARALETVENSRQPLADHLRLKLAAEFAVRIYADLQNELGFRPGTEITE